VSSVSCGSAVFCGAAGYYTDASGDFQGFVVTRTGVTWGAVIDPSAIGSKAALGAESISCTATRFCTAVGDDVVSDGSSVGFVVSDTNGAWATRMRSRSPRPRGGGRHWIRCRAAFRDCAAAGNGLYPDSAIAGATPTSRSSWTRPSVRGATRSSSGTRDVEC